jgi:hypothetical protein
MSMVSEALREEKSHAGERRTVAGVVNSIETLNHGDSAVDYRRSGRDPLGDSRQRVRAQRRANARISTVGEPAEARQDHETALPGDLEQGRIGAI